MKFSSQFMFMLAGLAKPRLPGKPKLMCSFSSNAILVSFNVHAGRACQPSAARKPEKFCRFRPMRFSSRLRFMLAGLANRRQPGNPPKFAVFRQCNSRLNLCSFWPGLQTVGCPETFK
jgi:hypothetical protein